jgi:outer membrane receptor protein involved in Fe transport
MRLLAFAAIPVALLAQVDTGVITGNVQDNQGAMVPGAKVVITNTGTNARLETATNSGGLYVSPPLPSGNYRIEVSMTGFRPVASTAPLSVTERIAVNFKLELGALTESVTVQELAPLLQTETTTLGTQRSEAEFKSIPINSRNFAEVIRFTPGVVPGQPVKQNLALSQQRGNVSNVVNGASFGDNNFLVDGLQNNNNHQGWGLINYPEIEALEQYRIDTSVPDARFGRSGGAVQVAYKSGTSELHGVLFEFLRNSALDARNFFATGEKPALRRNMFGGTLGGPIGRKGAKTFFFVSYEGQRSRQSLTFLNAVPTPLMRNGDFSELATGARPIRIHDPLTTRNNARDPFPNNVIPASRINPTAKRIMDLYPLPNNSNIAANFLLNPSDSRDSDQGSAKIDRDFSAGSRAYFRLTRASSRSVNARALGPVATPFLDVGIPVTQAVASHTHVITPRIINQARVGLSREPVRSVELNGNKPTATEFGIPNVNVDDLSMGLPILNVGGYASIGANGNIPAIIVSQNTEFSNNLDAILGNHNFKAGFNVVFRQTNAHQANQGRGSFGFSAFYTTNPATPANTGYGGADLLLGRPATILLSALTGTRGLRRSDWGFFLQDDWKATPRLTLNLGLRYEIPLNYPMVEVADRMLQFDLETALPAPVGQGKFPWRSGIPNDLNNFGPRVGIAYKLGRDTVVRSAYGIYYSIVPIPIGITMVSNPPLVINTTVNNNQNDFLGARSINDGPLRTANPNAAGQNRIGIQPDFRVPYVQQWNLAVQRQVPGGQQLTVAYVGTKGTRLVQGWEQLAGINFNQAVPGDGAVNNRRRWPQHGNVSIFTSNANSTYHSMQATLVKRWANSLHYQLAYTWSHAIDNREITQLPISDLRGAKGNSDNDVRHQFRSTFGYQLPWAAKKLWGGWELNGALSLYTGFPFSVLAGSNTLNNGENTRADRLRDGTLPGSERTIARWFNLDAFSNPGFRLYGNGGRNVLNGPGTRTLDFSVFKNFPVGEGRRVQFRAESFNISNTPQFNQPTASIGAANSGRILSAGSEATLQRTQRQVQLALKLLF